MKPKKPAKTKSSAPPPKEAHFFSLCEWSLIPRTEFPGKSTGPRRSGPGFWLELVNTTAGYQASAHPPVWWYPLRLAGKWLEVPGAFSVSPGVLTSTEPGGLRASYPGDKNNLVPVLDVPPAVWGEKYRGDWISFLLHYARNARPRAWAANPDFCHAAFLAWLAEIDPGPEPEFHSGAEPGQMAKSRESTSPEIREDVLEIILKEQGVFPGAENRNLWLSLADILLEPPRPENGAGPPAFKKMDQVRRVWAVSGLPRAAVLLLPGLPAQIIDKLFTIWERLVPRRNILAEIIQILSDLNGQPERQERALDRCLDFESKLTARQRPKAAERIREIAREERYPWLGRRLRKLGEVFATAPKIRNWHWKMSRNLEENYIEFSGRVKSGKELGRLAENLLEKQAGRFVDEYVKNLNEVDESD